MMKVFVTGASGLLGRAVYARAKSQGHEVLGTAYSRPKDGLIKLDLHDEQEVASQITQFAPDVLIHCAAERRPDVAEKDPEAARKLNVQVPRLLANLANKQGFTIIYISTDYVFDGQAPSGGYEPDDATNPTNLYGQTKADGEKEILEHGPKGKAVVLRVPVLYGEANSHDESAVNILLTAVKNKEGKEKVNMDDWGARFPTCVHDIARVLIDLSALSRERSLPWVLHFSAQQRFTKYSISELFASLYDPPLSTSHLVRVTAGPGPGETVRPRDCHLSNRALDGLGVSTNAVDFKTWWTKYLQDIGEIGK